VTWPEGPQFVCFDATALVHYQDNGHLDTLRDLIPGRKFTPNAVTGLDLVKTPAARAMNQQILDATWLESVPVDAPDDIRRVATLRALWPSSAKGRNHGEAEVVVLCERYGWIGVMDDHHGREAARDGRKMPYVYMSTMLIAAAAVGRNGLTDSTAWAIHSAVESRRRRPRIQDEAVFRLLVRVFHQAWLQDGQPGWPEFLANPQLDLLVDRADPLP